MKSVLKKFKKDRAITLIALVITIVVLIILATVVINLSLGDNGIFNRAREAKEQYKNAQDDEETQIAKITNQIDKYSTFTRAGGSNINYSTSEQDTGLKWIDDKNIYQKTIKDLNISMSWINQNLTQSSNLTPLISNVDRIINILNVKCEPTTGGYIIMSADIRVLPTGEWKLFGVEDYPITELTLQYTKTTN